KSKAERGYELLEDRQLGAARAEPIELAVQTTAGEALRVIGLACVRHFALNEAAVLAKDPEAVHQMRVGLRRLRAVLSLFKQMLDDPESEGVKSELRWLSQALDPARDFDV